jgi:hypothetical protein
VGRRSALLAVALLVGSCSQSEASDGSPSSVASLATIVAQGVVSSSTTSTTSRPIVSATTVPERFAGIPLGRTDCAPSSPFAGGEIRGTSNSGVELYGLVFARSLPIRAGDEVKIVWRMTGVGGLAARSTSPSGSPVDLASPPVEHRGSNYNRPGDEWGTVHLFNEPGCWHLTLARYNSQADVWLTVAPRES